MLLLASNNETPALQPQTGIAESPRFFQTSPACRHIPEWGACMSPVPRWFDRKFEFGFPPEQHPNLCVRLRGTPVRLEEIVRGCSHDVLVRKDRKSTRLNSSH